MVAQEKPLTPDAASPDVKESITYELGNRLLTVERVTENTITIRLAAQDHPPPLSNASDGPEATDAYLDHSLGLGGAVYCTAGGLTRSLITCWTGTGSEPIVFWSSIDWNLLTADTLATPRGDRYSLFLLLDNEDLAETARQAAEQGETYTPPQVPDFANGPASYRIVSGKATLEILNELDELHAIHDREYQALTIFWKKRE